MVFSFPNELLLELFSFLPLKSLISSRGVGKKWRYLVPLSSILPARRALLDLYYHVIEIPDFLATRASVATRLKPFNRHAYVAALEEPEDCVLPDEFRMWILEWPERAVFRSIWPGLVCSPLEDIGRLFTGALCFPLEDKGVADLRPIPDGQYPDVSAFCINIEVWDNNNCRGHIILVADKRQIGTKFYGTVHWFLAKGRDIEQYFVADAFSWAGWLRKLAVATWIPLLS